MRVITTLLLFATAFSSVAASVLSPQEVAVPEPLTVTADFANDAWVDSNQPIALRLSRPLDLQTERLAVVIGRTDLSALFTVTPTVARYQANNAPLPNSETV